MSILIYEDIIQQKNIIILKKQTYVKEKINTNPKKSNATNRLGRIIHYRARKYGNVNTIT